MKIPPRISRSTRRPRSGVLGLLVLGACSPMKEFVSRELDPTRTAEGPYERFPSGTDARGMMRTFRPTGEYNPSSYMVLGFVRGADGKTYATPFVGHFQSQGKSEKGFWHLAAFPRTDETKAIAAGIGHTILGEKATVGYGVTAFPRSLAQEVAAKFELGTNTQLLWSADLSNVPGSTTYNLKQNLGTFAGTTIIGYVEGGNDGKQDLRLGTSFERGKWALDSAWEEGAQAINLQLARGFGEKGKHFFYIGMRDPEGQKPSFMFGVNFTEYLLGKRRPRRVKLSGSRPHPNMRSTSSLLRQRRANVRRR